MKFRPSPHQAAGHAGILEAGPVFAKKTNQQEIDFYNEAKLRSELQLNALGSELYDWMPVFMGTLTQGAIENPDAITLNLDVSNGLSVQETTTTEDQYIVLQNLLYKYKNPCILDIKLGAVLVDDTVSEEKRQRLAKVSAETTSGSLHFRVCGMKVFNGNSDKKPKELFPGQNDTISVEDVDGAEEAQGTKYLKFNKFFGRSLNTQTAKNGIKLFFTETYPSQIRKALIIKFHQRLQLLYNCLVDAEVRIKSGSLFFCYDAGALSNLLEEEYEQIDPIIAEEELEDSDEELETGEASESLVAGQAGAPSKLKFIDFAHSNFTDGQGHDENMIIGVENLINIFKELVDELETGSS